jgi:hypothetical protein
MVVYHKGQHVKQVSGHAAGYFSISHINGYSYINELTTNKVLGFNGTVEESLNKDWNYDEWSKLPTKLVATFRYEVKGNRGTIWYVKDFATIKKLIEAKELQEIEEKTSSRDKDKVITFDSLFRYLRKKLTLAPFRDNS